MNMVGQTIDARSTISKSSIVLLVAAAALVAWALAASNAHLAIAAVLPFCLALGFWVGQPPHALVMVESDGLTPLGSPDKAHYTSIHAVAVGGVQYVGDIEQLPALPMEIHHEGGCLTLPPKMSVSPVELFRYLISRVPARPTKPVHPRLAEYCAAQQEKFGPDKVQILQARERIPQPWRRRADRWAVAAIFLAGLLWMVAGAACGAYYDEESYVAWIVFGCLTMIGSFLAFLVLRYGSRSQADATLARFPDACIVIGPAGLAMVQGDMQGALRWDEIIKVTSRIPQAFRVRGAASLQLMVRGGEIVVFDIYDRSPAELEQLVRRNLDQSVAGPRNIS